MEQVGKVLHFKEAYFYVYQKKTLFREIPITPHYTFNICMRIIYYISW